MKLEYIKNENDNYKTIKDVLKQNFKLSRNLILKLKLENKIYLNNKESVVNTLININDNICVNLDFIEDNSNVIPVKMDLDIVYEDECLLVLNKPYGIAIHATIGNVHNSISNGVKYYFDSIHLKRKIRPVNRLDTDTSGLCIFAKNEYIQDYLVKQMKNDCFLKEYIAICDGHFDKKTGIIDAPIARKEGSIIQRCINDTGDISITHFSVINEFSLDLKNISIVKCILKTGRTHQIRVHLKHIGHPILGDTLYSNSSNLIKRQALHSYRTSFYHPILKYTLELTAPVPSDIDNFFKFCINKKKES